MEQQQQSGGFQFAIARARDGGFIASTGAGEVAEFACARSTLFEMHEWIGQQLQNGYGETVHRPAYQPPQPAHVPQIPRPRQPPPAPQQREEPFEPPQFMQERPLVDRIAEVQAGNGQLGKLASFVLAGFLLVQLWPFGA